MNGRSTIAGLPYNMDPARTSVDPGESRGPEMNVIHHIHPLFVKSCIDNN